MAKYNELKAQLPTATEEDKKKIITEAKDYEKKFKSYKESERSRIQQMVINRREERRKTMNQKIRETKETVE